MATVTKGKKSETLTKGDVATVKVGEAPKPVRLKKDGTPWGVPQGKRTNAELAKDYKQKLANLTTAYEKTKAKYEKRIAIFSSSAVSKEDAAKELLAGGMTPAEIEALEAKLRKAKAALKGMSPEEVEALKAKAVEEKAALPSFITGDAPVAAPAAEVEDEEEDEEDEE